MANGNNRNRLSFLSDEELADIQGIPQDTPPGGLGSPASSTDFVNQILSQLEKAPTPEPPRISLGQAIGGALADALTAKARVLSGAPAPMEGPFARRVRNQRELFEQEQRRIQQSERDLRNQIRISSATKAQDDKTARERMLYQQGLIAQRQQLNDLRDAEIDEQEFVRDGYQELVESGWAPPQGFKVAEATPQTLMAHRTAFLQQQMTDEMALFTSQLQDARDRLGMTIKRLDLEPGEKPQVSLGPKETKEQKEKKTPRLTPKQISDYSRLLGENVHEIIAQPDGMSLLNDKLAALGREQQEWVKLPTGVDKELRGLIAIVDTAEELRHLMSTGDVGGAETLGFATNANARRFRNLSLNLNDLILRERTGAQANEEEQRNQTKWTVMLGKLQRNNIAGVEEILRFYGGAQRLLAEQHRIPDSQMASLRKAFRGNNTVESTVLEGMIKVAD